MAKGLFVEIISACSVFLFPLSSSVTYFHNYNYVIEFIFYGVRQFVKVERAISLADEGEMPQLELVLFTQTIIQLRVLIVGSD